MAPIEDKDEVEAKEEDSPAVKELKVLDDEYLAIEQEYEKAVSELTKKYDAKRKPFFEERKKVLTVPTEDASKTGTPVLKGFWLKALSNHPAFDDVIQEWDEPVLEYLSDITTTPLDDTDRNKGFKLEFHFVENPYFSNTELFVECHTDESNPYYGNVEAKEIKSSKIDWKEGKDVTVKKVTKKVKGGGAKKSKAKGKETSEAQQSFFGRFLNVKPGEIDMEELLKCLPAEAAEELEEMDEDDVCEMVMEQIADGFNAVQENIIPFAVRWYTGEADPNDSDDEDDDEEDEEEDDDESSEEEPAPKAKAKGGKAKKSPNSSPKLKAGAEPTDQQKEECKQQ